MFQQKVLNSSRVKIYKVKVYNIDTDEVVISRRWATEAGAKTMGGEIIPDTGVLVNQEDLEQGEQWTKKDFMPSNTEKSIMGISY